MLKGKKMLLSVFLGALFSLVSTVVYSTDTDWSTTAATNELGTGSNWDGGSVPTSSTNAVFGVSPTYLLTGTTGGLTAVGIRFDVSDPTGYSLTANGQTFSIGVNGVENDSTQMQIIQAKNGGIVNIAAVPGGVASLGNKVNYTVGDVGNIGNNLNLQGLSIGNGKVYVWTGNTFTVGGNTVIGELDGQGSTVLNGSLTITSIIDFPSIGSISGPGAFIVSVIDGPPYDYMYLNGPLTYTGGTVINGGTVIPLTSLPLNKALTINGGSLIPNENQTVGNLSGLGGTIFWNGPTNFTVNQTANATFAGQLISTYPGSSFTLGTVGLTTATGTLQLTGKSIFDGNVTINSGNLQVNGVLGGTFLVNSGATLSGNGIIGSLGSTATIANGGSIRPGNSVGVMTNAGNQVFNVGSFFQLEENGLTSSFPSNNLLIVAGTTTVGVGGSPIVRLFPTTNLINLNTRQAFIESAGGLTVTNPFTLDDSALAGIFNLELIDPELSYDANNYYITTQTTFAPAVLTDGGDSTSIEIALELDAISNPNTSVNIFLNELAQLSTDELIAVLDDLSGAQYSNDLFAVNTANRKFLRRLYDPIRAIVTTEPNCCCQIINCCGCEPIGFDIWASAGGGQSQVNGHHGLKFNEWNATLGAQYTFSQDWTVGIAGSYEQRNLNHHHSLGDGRGYTWFGGLYGLYRPSCFYVLADLVYSYTQHKINRHLFIGDIEEHFRSRPIINQVTFYAEAGMDFTFCSFLIQPFVGIEVAGVNRKRFTETDIDMSGLALSLRKHDRTLAVSSLGVHLTDQFQCGTSVSVDLAWLYRFTSNNRFDASFVSFTTLDEGFTVFGPNIGRNSGAGAITLSQEFCNNWRVFLEASGEIWSKASTYTGLAGVQVTW